MNRDAVRAFVARDRERVDALKRAHHAEQARTHGPERGFLLGQQLREHARRVRPEWPTPADRADDLAHHLELKRKLDRAAHAFAGR
jgi:hypothetical protein